MKVHTWGRVWFVRYIRYKKYMRIGIVGVLLLAGIVVYCSHGQDGQAETVPVLQMDVVGQAVPETYHGMAKEMLSGIVSFGWVFHEPELSLRDAMWQLLTGILPENGYHQVAGGIPLLQAKDGRITKIITEEEAYYASAWIADIWKHSFEQVGNLALSEEVQVILYHTHNAETYLPDDGVSKVNGQNGGVVDAGKVFQAALQKKYGLRTAHSTTIHDYPNWSRSYQNSLNTARQLLQAYPEAKAVFDIHRDTGFTSKNTTTATVHGRKAAKIMMVIGCNHENWQENLAFARLLETKCNQLYPGLLRENIRIKETGRYNQQVNGHAVLLEIGSDLNTQAEAEYSMECFAHVVYEVLKEMES